MPDTPINEPVTAFSVDLNPAPPVPDVSATEPTVPGGGVDATSVLATLQRLRSKLGAKADPLDIPLPGYEGLLILRCRWIPFKDLSAGADDLATISEPTEQSIAAAADTLVLTCQEFRIKVGDETRPLSEDAVPVTFGDPRLPGLLGFDPVDSARDAARATLANEYALIGVGNQIVRWLQDTTKKLDQSYLGK